MPSTRDPVAVVQPGPGRLPANTVPANALIFPSTGGTDAALQAHITDPVDAHMASAIGQLGYAGSSWSVAAGGTNLALQELFYAANARESWVLDSNPAATDADFAGPNALITAYATLNGYADKGRHVLFLRQGTYNWDDALVLNNVRIVGATAITPVTTINNAAGNVRIGTGVTIENIAFNVTGNFTVAGAFTLGFNQFRNVGLTVTGQVLVPSMFNAFNQVRGGSGSGLAFLSVTNQSNTFIDCLGFQISLGALASFTQMNGVAVIGSAHTPGSPAVSVACSNSVLNNVRIDSTATGFLAGHITVSGSANTLNGVSFDTTPDGGAAALLLSGNGNTVTGLSLANLVNHAQQFVSYTGTGNTITDLLISATDTKSSDFVAIGGTNNVLLSYTVDGVTNTNSVGANILQFNNTNCRVENVYCTGLDGYNAAIIRMIGTNNTVGTVLVANTLAPGATFGLISMEGDGCRAQNIEIVGVPSLQSTSTLVTFTAAASSSVIDRAKISGLVTPAGKLLTMLGDHCTMGDFEASDLGTIQANFAAVSVQGTENNLIRARVEGIPANAGATAALADLSGTRMSVRDVAFNNIGTSSSVGIHLVTVSGSGVVEGVVAEDLSGTGIRCDRAINVSSIADAVIFRDCRVALVASSNGNVFNAASTSSRLTVENCTFLGRGTGVVGTNAVMFMSACRNVSVTNCQVSALAGLAGCIVNTSGVFTNVRFAGDSFSAGTGNQLFAGYGFVGGSIIEPLVLRDIQMEYGSSNCNPLSGVGAGSPVVYLGGVGDAPVTDHGPFVIEGLLVVPGSSVTAQHRDSTVVFDDVTGIATGPASSVSGLQVNLREIPWSATGTGRGTINSQAGVVEIASGSVTQGRGPLAVDDLQIINVVEGSFGVDARYLLNASNANIRGLRIDGPTSGTHGSGSFASGTGVIEVSSCRVTDWRIFNQELLNISSGSFMESNGSILERGGIMIDAATVTPTVTYWLELTGGNNFVDTLAISNIHTTATATALVGISSTATTRLRNSSFSVSSEAMVSFQLHVTGSDVFVRDSSFTTSFGGHTTFSRVYLENANRVTVDNCAFEGDLNVLASPITLSNAEFCTISKNLITATYLGTAVNAIRRGISLVTSSNNNKIVDNTFSSTEFGTASLAITQATVSVREAAIYLDSSSGRNTVANNMINQTSGHLAAITDSSVSMAVQSGGLQLITGYTGASGVNLGGCVFIAGAATGNNNGFFKVAELVSSTSIRIYNPLGVSDANNGSISITSMGGYCAILADGSIDLENIISGNNCSNAVGGVAGGVFLYIFSGSAVIVGNSIFGSDNSGFSVAIYSDPTASNFNTITGNSVYNSGGPIGTITVGPDDEVAGNVVH